MTAIDPQLDRLRAKMHAEDEALRREAWKWNEPAREAAVALAQAIRPAPLTVRIARLRTIEDLRYVRGSWSEGHKNAPGVGSMSWRYYKRYVVPEIERCLARDDTQVLGAWATDGAIVGWLAFARGKRVSTIHWVHTRYRVGEDGEQLRRRGVMTQLLDAAELGNRIVYTWKGAYPRHRSDGTTVDERLLPWLSARGQHAAYVVYEEWIK